MIQFDNELLCACWFLAGPTACGKSACGLELAERLQSEVVALDSMTLYRGMDIGTAKPSPADRERVPHHLLDILDPSDECSLADYLELAEAACRQIIGRGRRPLFVGGTGLYLRAVLRGIFHGPPADWNLRENLQSLADQEGTLALYNRLRDVDPALAARLHPGDVRRVIRGIEVYELTGKPLSIQQRQDPLPADRRPRHVYWLNPPRAWLYERIDSRVREMFEAGLVAEVQYLLAARQPLSRTARQALGYKEIIGAIEGGLSPDATIELIQTRTRQFAKRQHTWFRNLEECCPVALSGTESPRGLADRIFRLSDG